MFSPDLKFLYGLYREGIKLDLSATMEFAQSMGNPQNNFRSFHIAGTNGKGSTAAYIYNILMEKDNTGLYTSPHLIKFNERIIAGREQITDEEIIRFIQGNKPLIEELSTKNRNPTFFEASTIMAFQHFADKNVKYASIEVGLGGRLDSTNIIEPEVSVITQVGYEHADKLGCSLTSIAGEKAGIVKPGRPVVLGDTKREVIETVRKFAESRNSSFIHSPSVCRITELEQDIRGSRFNLSTPTGEYRIDTSMVGRFQPGNICTAILAVESSKVDTFSEKDIERGISRTRWPGRMDIIRKDPVVMVDGAHNPPAANALRVSMEELKVKSPTLLLGMLSDKDAFSFLRIMRMISGKAIFTTPDEPVRAIPAGTLAKMAEGIFKDAVAIDDPLEAYERAIATSDFVLVAGSLYLVGAIMEHERAPVMPYAAD